MYLSGLHVITSLSRIIQLEVNYILLGISRELGNHVRKSETWISGVTSVVPLVLLPLTNQED